ncbi:MAG: carbon starvation protein A, partial [Bacteroidaceae bacterium]|nr:carbon starvation protein A [Bacteroidaceae bacterium]
HGRPIFYGAMVAEGIVALIWAAAVTWFFQENGIVDQVTGKAFSGAIVATRISYGWLGTFGGILAVLGIVVAPITSGDTALRSARLIMADFLHFDQKKIRNRLLICVPLFAITMAILVYSLTNANGFKVIWGYFAWCNQTMAVFTLWTITVYLALKRKNFYVTLLPALLMTCVCSTYICMAPEGFAMPTTWGYPIGGLCALVGLIWFMIWKKKAFKIT